MDGFSWYSMVKALKSKIDHADAVQQTIVSMDKIYCKQTNHLNIFNIIHVKWLGPDGGREYSENIFIKLLILPKV